MRIIGLAGWSGSGKTTLITKLIPRLIARGVKVSTLKHAHHGFDLDQPGKDSFFHRAAGATEVIISSAKRWAILHELREEPEWDLGGLVAKMSPVDLVLVEGFKRDVFPKLEIHRAANGKPLIHPDDPHIVAIASDIALPQAKVPVMRRVLRSTLGGSYLKSPQIDPLGLLRAVKSGLHIEHDPFAVLEQFSDQRPTPRHVIPVSNSENNRISRS
jgi:molybdopterin-guanine dinucleotide biosynthesis protein MobB